jgi:hypothetical protein
VSTDRLLPLVRLAGDRSPLLIAGTAVLVLGALGSLVLPLGRHPAEIYRAGIQLWTTVFATGYVLWILLYEIDRSGADLRALLPDRARADVGRDNPFARNRHPGILLAFTLGGMAFGIVFNVLVDGVLHQIMTGRAMSWAYAWGPPILVVLWGVVFHAFWILIDNARLLAEIGEHDVRIDLNELSALDVFADAGSRHFLLLLGGLAVLPIQAILGEGMDLRDIVPGIFIVLPVAIYLFVWPMLAVRRAIQRAQAAALRAIDEALRSLTPLEDRHLLLSIRRHQVAAIPAWPVRLRNLGRLALYLVIPPLAWVAAALVDAMVSRYV